MTDAIRSDRRFVNGRRCPVCDGADGDARGKEKRCHGYISSNEKYIHCSREELANGIAMSQGSETYAHLARGKCKCGTQHAEAEATSIIERIYQYCDEDGRVLSEAVRYTPKKFKQRRNEYDWTVAGVRRVPYRLPDLLKADVAEPILIVEGEKDVHTLVDRGFVATTNSEGAKKFKHIKVDALKVFVGRQIIVIPDNDDPNPKTGLRDGDEHAKQVIAELATKVGVVARRLDLEGAKDITAWFGAGGTTERLRELVVAKLAEEAPPPSAPPQVPPMPSASNVAPSSEPDWKRGLLVEDNAVRRCIHNICLFVEQHPLYAGKWSLNEMIDAPCLDGAPVTEITITAIKRHIDLLFGFSATASTSDISEAIRFAATQRPFHPVRDYLKAVTWDGVERLDLMASELLGTRNPTHAVFIRKWMIAAVARAMSPGCKVDNVLVLQGEQGLMKSWFFSVLGEPWYSDSRISGAGDKDASMQIHAHWIYELAEIEYLIAGRSGTTTKGWITSRQDSFRAPYAREVKSRPRSVVFCGTTNQEEPLEDPTGDRRFWIVPVTSRIDREALALLRPQLWAEAMHRYQAGEQWWLTAAEERGREESNQDFTSNDNWLEIIRQNLTRPKFITNQEITMCDILGENCLDIDVEHRTLRTQQRAGAAMKKLGWKRFKRGSKHDRHYVYVRELTIDDVSRVPVESQSNSDPLGHRNQSKDN